MKFWKARGDGDPPQPSILFDHLTAAPLQAQGLEKELHNHSILTSVGPVEAHPVIELSEHV